MTEDEILRRIEKVREDVQAGRPERPLNGPVDPKDQAEHRADVIAARDRRNDIWNQVMEHHGFRWYEPRQLDATIGPEKYIPKTLEGMPNANLYWTRPHRVGQWRRHRGGKALAFTMDDLWGLFGEPVAFDRWIRRQDLQAKAAQAGIVLPG